MSDIDVMKLRERCVDMALRLHPNRTIYKMTWIASYGYRPEEEILVPKLDDVLATARILFEYISPAVATKRSPNGTFDRTKYQRELMRKRRGKRAPK